VTDITGNCPVIIMQATMLPERQLGCEKVTDVSHGDNLAFHRDFQFYCSSDGSSDLKPITFELNLALNF